MMHRLTDKFLDPDNFWKDSRSSTSQFLGYDFDSAQKNDDEIIIHVFYCSLILIGYSLRGHSVKNKDSSLCFYDVARREMFLFEYGFLDYSRRSTSGQMLNSTEDPMREMMKMLESVYNKACNQPELRCDQRPFHSLLMGYGFLTVFLLAMFGNCINLLIYNSDQIRYYIAIRMLCTRLLMNSFAMLFLLPQALRTVEVWEPNSAADHVYWRYYPYQAYFVNVFGFCAMCFFFSFINNYCKSSFELSINLVVSIILTIIDSTNKNAKKRNIE
uniref:G_PROTEIN_RECEP_F1_2 domain-containing protein n=1 Tax=Heterorhabditis bacteriophora TaxID=37862 RepID=A0A1I7WUA9_HETBA